MRDSRLPGQVDEAIDSIAELERRTLAGTTRHQRAIERFTLSVGRPRTVVAIVVLVVLWTGINSALIAGGRRPFDPPPFFWLQGLVGLGAFITTILILTTENRLTELEEQRDRLHLQISLLAERKATKIIALVEELRRDLPTVPNREDPEAAAMTDPVDPRAIVRELDRRAPGRAEDVPPPA